MTAARAAIRLFFLVPAMTLAETEVACGKSKNKSPINPCIEYEAPLFEVYVGAVVTEGEPIPATAYASRTHGTFSRLDAEVLVNGGTGPTGNTLAVRALFCAPDNASDTSVHPHDTTLPPLPPGYYVISASTDGPFIPAYFPPGVLVEPASCVRPAFSDTGFAGACQFYELFEGYRSCQQYYATSAAHAQRSPS